MLLSIYNKVEFNIILTVGSCLSPLANVFPARRHVDALVLMVRYWT